MANRSYAPGHFELFVADQRVGRFETLLAATVSGGPPRSLQTQELFLLVAPSAAPASKVHRHFFGIASRIGQGVATPGTPSLGAGPGTANPRTVALKHGQGDATALRYWSNRTMRDLAIVVIGAAGQPVARYHIENPWPTKWYSPPSALGDGDVAIEEIVIAYERLRHG